MGNRDGIVTEDEWLARQRSTLFPSALRALRLEPGGKVRELWKYEKNFFGVTPSPLVYQGVLYVMRNGGILTSFDPKTGDRKSTRLNSSHRT